MCEAIGLSFSYLDSRTVAGSKLLAYAVTIHKWQGLEFAAVVMPVAMHRYLLCTATSSTQASHEADN